jgi:hypothetical protein
MKNNLNESAVIFHRRSGHNHDGENSTKVDFSTYSDEELRPILERLGQTDVNIGGEDTSSSGGTSGGSTGATTGLDSIYFHMPGEIYSSPDIVAKKLILYATSALNVVATLGYASSEAIVVTLYKGSDVIGSITIPAGQGVDVPVTTTISVSFNGTTDLLSAKVTDPGTGGQELGVEVVALP